ncbi:hypothetical protein ED733_003243 [Metarhizium rileyi]|uniref:Deuterolysin n=1 Tax=Metarhizium rileyi (strain RCEF 4871) TaxID=1649241 RepID=A0A5C6GNL4_METRR|nr:hypothetical protein ED733_003243 [Metarhizium rileyi]
MKFSALVAAAAAGAASASVLQSELAVNTQELETKPYQGLDEVQSKYAGRIIAQVKMENLGPKACQTAITTSLMESTLIMHANERVPESLTYEHERLGYDGDSVGLFQQRALFYTDIKCSMDAVCSAHQFLARMKEIPEWETIDVGTLAQKVQRSEQPERYHQFVDQSVSICNLGGL